MSFKRDEKPLDGLRVGINHKYSPGDVLRANTNLWRDYINDRFTDTCFDKYIPSPTFYKNHLYTLEEFNTDDWFVDSKNWFRIELMLIHKNDLDKFFERV